MATVAAPLASPSAQFRELQGPSPEHTAGNASAEPRAARGRAKPKPISSAILSASVGGTLTYGLLSRNNIFYIPHAIVLSSIAYLLVRLEMANSSTDLFFWERAYGASPISHLLVDCSQPLVSAIVYPFIAQALTAARVRQAHQKMPAAQWIIAAAFLCAGTNIAYMAYKLDEKM